MSAHSPQPSLWQAGRALVRRDLQLLCGAAAAMRCNRRCLRC